jgi:hypothetical protein
MTDIQKIFFGALLAFLVSIGLFILPLSMEVRYVCLIVLVFISLRVYDRGYLFKRTIKTTDNDWTDIDHLRWTYNRMKHIHKENENYDYMIRLKTIIDKLDKED